MKYLILLFIVLGLAGCGGRGNYETKETIQAVFLSVGGYKRSYATLRYQGQAIKVYATRYCHANSQWFRDDVYLTKFTYKDGSVDFGFTDAQLKRICK